MSALLSPREVARSIGVSESSVKRWIDDGLIPATRTAGGHRRIAQMDAVQFVRTSRSPLVAPEVLGLHDLAQAAEGGLKADAEQLHDLLLRGSAAKARGLLLMAYLEGAALASVFDDLVRVALGRIGDRWPSHQDGIFVEHRAVGICAQAIHQIRATHTRFGNTLAVGGAVSGDVYQLPSLMVAAVVESLGVRAMNLGPDTPCAALATAVERESPDLLWLSASAVARPLELSREIKHFIDSMNDRVIPLIVGGREQDRIDVVSDRIHRARSLGELAAFVKGLHMLRKDEQ